MFVEAHPDAIGPDGVATVEAYQNDLLYLKKKVFLIDLMISNLIHLFFHMLISCFVLL